MYHISDTAKHPQNVTKNKLVLFDEDEIEMLTKAETLTVLTIQQQLDLLAVDEKIEKEKNAKNIIPSPAVDFSDLPFEELLDLEAAMFDDRSLYLRPKVSVLVPNCGEDLHKELVRKLHICHDVYINVVFQNVHQFGSRMIFQPHLELSKLETIQEKAELSDQLKSYVTNLGKATYDILVQSEVLGNPVDLEVYRSVGVKYEGENRLITTHVDMVTYHTEIPEDGSDTTGELSLVSEDYSYSNDSNSVIEESVKSDQALDSDCRYSDDTFNSENNSNTEFEDSIIRLPFKSLHKRAAVSFLLTLRQSIPVKKIFHQHLASMGQPDLTMYLFVCHLGPLVDNQVVLYQYRSRVTGQPLEGADISAVMKSWTRLQGRLVFPVTPIEELVKHSIYRYEGLSKKKKEKKRRKVIKLYID